MRKGLRKTDFGMYLELAVSERTPKFLLEQNGITEKMRIDIVNHYNNCEICKATLENYHEYAKVILEESQQLTEKYYEKFPNINEEDSDEHFMEFLSDSFDKELWEELSEEQKEDFKYGVHKLLKQIDEYLQMLYNFKVALKSNKESVVKLEIKKLGQLLSITNKTVKSEIVYQKYKIKMLVRNILFDNFGDEPFTNLTYLNGSDLIKEYSPTFTKLIQEIAKNIEEENELKEKEQSLVNKCFNKASNKQPKRTSKILDKLLKHIKSIEN